MITKTTVVHIKDDRGKQYMKSSEIYR